MPATSRRTAELGTENAFVVLAEVNDLVRQGKDIISFCIGQPDFPTPDEHPGRGGPGDPRRQARLHAVGRDRRAARSGRAVHGRDARARHPSRARRGRRRREAVHRLHDPRRPPTTASATRSSIRTRASRSTSRRSRRTAPCRCRCRLREARNFAFDPADLEAKLTPRTRLLILNSPHNPTGGILDAQRPRGDRRGPRAASRRLDLRGRDLLAALSTRASSPRSPRFPGCTSARSSPTARRRPGR